MRLIPNVHGSGDLVHFHSGRMTPMIDVVFLLLVFFMCGMGFRRTEGRLDASLPAETCCDEEDDSIPVRIRLEQEEGGGVSIFIQDIPIPSFTVLRMMLHRIAVASDRTLPVLIDGAPDVPFDAFLTTLDSCRDAGLQPIWFAQPRIS